MFAEDSGVVRNTRTRNGEYEFLMARMKEGVVLEERSWGS